MNPTRPSTLQSWLRDYCSQSAVLTGSVVLAAPSPGGGVHVLAEWPERSDINQPLIDAATTALERKLDAVVVPPVMQSAQGPQRIVQVLLGESDAPCVIALGINSANDAVAQGYLADLRGHKSALDQLLQAPEHLDSGPAATLLGRRRRCSATRTSKRRPSPSSTNWPASFSWTGPALACLKTTASRSSRFPTTPPSNTNRNCCAALPLPWKKRRTRPPR